MTDEPLTPWDAHPSDTKDYRRRYSLPLNWVHDEYSTHGIDYAGYISLVLQLLAPLPASTILDAGCGDGRVASDLVAMGHRVVGIDYAERAVAFSRLFVPEAEFHTCDLRDLKVERFPQFRARFDAALLVETIEHVPAAEQSGVLHNLKQCLKPGGRLILSVPSVHLPTNEWHYKHFTLPEVIELLEDAGFGIERVLFQHRISALFRYPLWRFIHNRCYDLTIVRKWLRQRFLAAYNLCNDERAGRYIVMARCVGAPAFVPTSTDPVQADLRLSPVR